MEVSKDLLFKVTPSPLLRSSDHHYAWCVHGERTHVHAASLTQHAWLYNRCKWLAYGILFFHFFSFCWEVSGPFVHSRSIDLRGSILLEGKIRSHHIYKSEEMDAKCGPLVYHKLPNVPVCPVAGLKAAVGASESLRS